ncbi:MAG: hypothetical protein ABI833_23915, partial [Acidobacteriota bacterium]
DGGVFQLRANGSGEILCELPNIQSGDAILFRISGKLNHRVSPMQGNEPKTAFAGWFRNRGPNFFSALQQLSGKEQNAGDEVAPDHL